MCTLWEFWQSLAKKLRTVTILPLKNIFYSVITCLIVKFLISFEFGYRLRQLRSQINFKCSSNFFDNASNNSAWSSSTLNTPIFFVLFPILYFCFYIEITPKIFYFSGQVKLITKSVGLILNPDGACGFLILLYVFVKVQCSPLLFCDIQYSPTVQKNVRQIG